MSFRPAMLTTYRPIVRIPLRFQRRGARKRSVAPGARYYRGPGAATDNQDSHSRRGTDGEQVT